MGFVEDVHVRTYVVSYVVVFDGDTRRRQQSWELGSPNLTHIQARSTHTHTQINNVVTTKNETTIER